MVHSKMQRIAVKPKILWQRLSNISSLSDQNRISAKVGQTQILSQIVAKTILHHVSKNREPIFISLHKIGSGENRT